MKNQIILALKVSRLLQQWDGLSLVGSDAYDIHVPAFVELLMKRTRAADVPGSMDGDSEEELCRMLTAIAPTLERNKYFATRLAALNPLPPTVRFQQS